MYIDNISRYDIPPPPSSSAVWQQVLPRHVFLSFNTSLMVLYLGVLINEQKTARGGQIEKDKTRDCSMTSMNNHERGNNVSAADVFFENKYTKRHVVYEHMAFMQIIEFEMFQNYDQAWSK